MFQRVAYLGVVTTTAISGCTIDSPWIILARKKKERPTSQRSANQKVIIMIGVVHTNISSPTIAKHRILNLHQKIDFYLGFILQGGPNKMYHFYKHKL